MLQAAPTTTLGDQLKASQQQIDLLLLEQSRLIAAFVESDEWEADGSASAYDWIRVNCHLTSNAVLDRVLVGERTNQLGESIKALDSGEIGFAHLTVMARTANALGERFEEGKLLKLARDHSPGKFHYKCLHYRHAVDPDSYARDEFEKYEQRHLTLSRWEDGSLILSGVLGPAEGIIFRNALEPLARPCGAHDRRTRGQRLADALFELTTCGGKQRVAMQVTTSIETLLGLVGAPGAENEFSLPISTGTVGRWACDCSLTRVLLQDSVVIDVGRSRRVVSGGIEKALKLRDRHCQWPGCERPASWCQGHHLKHWIEGGETNLGNLVLLCHRHHRMVHEGGWQLVRTDDGRLIAIAPTVVFGYPRGPD